ncbi:hypothetical protein [Burkholderia multivorans]|uniref:hypothetical protein n=1 Tax=Burkholderia multivorans TaxID=87883 RepID=UPI0021BEC4DD|nr:hypothetical protein [Burkholderia multivorans]
MNLAYYPEAFTLATADLEMPTSGVVESARAEFDGVATSLGKEGEYATSLQFQRLGMARDRVFELSWSAPVKTSLLGAWVQAESNNQ